MKKDWITFVKSPPIIDQADLKNSLVKPSGLGDLFAQIALFLFPPPLLPLQAFPGDH